jgi:multiple sugar transport system ATP-binding protein
MACIILEKVVKQFGPTAVLKEVSLEIGDGELLALVGPPGSGKSVLIDIISGIERQTSGEIYIDGRRVDRLPPRNRNMAVVSDSYVAYPYHTVYDNIAIPLRSRYLKKYNTNTLSMLGSMSRRNARSELAVSREALEVAKFFGIEQLLDRKPLLLSDEQRLHLALAGALVGSYSAVLMKDPLAKANASLGSCLRDKIIDLHRHAKATIIYSTQCQSDVLALADRIAVLVEGDLLQIGSLDELYREPADLRVAEIIGNPKINLLRGKIGTDHAIDVLGCTIPIKVEQHVGEPVSLGFRPENIVLSKTNDGDLSGRVHHVENNGVEVFVHVAVEGRDQPLVVRSDTQRANGLGVNTAVGINLLPQKALVFSSSGRRLPI